MNRRQKQAYIWHSRHEDYKQRIRQARRIIKKCYNNYENPYIAYSGGKDSIVLSHMVLSMYPDANVWHWDYGDDLMPRKYEKEVLVNIHDMGCKHLIVNKRKGKGENTSSGYKQFFGTIAENKDKYGWDIGLIGIRQQESCNRRQTYTDYFMNDCCYPLLKLTVDDIWAYIIKNKLNYPSSYDLMGDYEVWDKIRFVTFNDPEFDTLENHHGIFI